MTRPTRGRASADRGLSVDWRDPDCRGAGAGGGGRSHGAKRPDEGAVRDAGRRLFASLSGAALLSAGVPAHRLRESGLRKVASEIRTCGFVRPRGRRDAGQRPLSRFQQSPLSNPIRAPIAHSPAGKGAPPSNVGGGGPDVEVRQPVSIEANNSKPRLLRAPQPSYPGRQKAAGTISAMVEQTSDIATTDSVVGPLSAVPSRRHRGAALDRLIALYRRRLG
jgi:hypothetical protein